jgi:hypothetical protein
MGGGGLHKIAKPDMSFEPKITCSKIFIFQPILLYKSKCGKADYFSVTNLGKKFFSTLAREY